MDREQFDRLSRLVAAASTRRDALRLLVSGVVIGATTGLAGAPASARNKSRKRSHGQGRAHAQQIPLCPTTCNQNCSNRRLQGGANLTKCNLNERDLDEVQLNGANLTQACFGDASLRNANFRGANVSKTCFCGADLRGADFRGTSITQAQLACAKPGCDTILPNGKPAIVCGDNETCCDGICVNTRNDVENCGTCGNACGVCQGCAGGTCEDLPDFLFDCNGNPLKSDAPNLVCTADRSTGICDGGLCNCGPGGKYDADTNVCLCNQTNTDFCAQPPFENCCQILETCLVDETLFTTRILCVDCEPGARA